MVPSPLKCFWLIMSLDGSACSGLTNMFCIASVAQKNSYLQGRGKKKKKKHRAAQRICLDIEARPRWMTDSDAQTDEVVRMSWRLQMEKKKNDSSYI